MSVFECITICTLKDTIQKKKIWEKLNRNCKNKKKIIKKRNNNTN